MQNVQIEKYGMLPVK